MVPRKFGWSNAMTEDIRIRHAGPADRAALRGGIIELQEFERQFTDTRRPGEAMADAYLAWMEAEVSRGGAILVAEIDGVFVGFAACQLREVDFIAETADSNRFGSISDICVLPAWRGRRIAGLLLGAAERHLAPLGVSRVRINVLARNRSARQAYENAGFVAYEVLYEKPTDIGPPSARHPDSPPRAGGRR
jgi:ribosomal protein S18 acetylase RimI-like enzyme